MQDRSLAKHLTDRSGFVVVAELAAGPGFNFSPIEKFLRAFKEADTDNIPAGFDFAAITVPQNPGGAANLEPADVLARIKAKDLLGSLDFVPHVSCKDQNSDAITSALVGFRAQGIDSILALTGDKPVSSQGVFEIEAIGLLQLIQRMNYTAYLKAGPGQWDSIRQFFAGAAVSPFKYTEASQMQQYYKMEKKIDAGARFLITQVGWDWRKSVELMQYLKENHIGTPVLGNVYLLTTVTPAPRLMHDVKLPGCFVSDELYAKLQSESIADHIERAAQQVAMYKAIGAAGVDLGGLLDFDTFVKILQRADEIGNDWEKHKDNLCWPGGERFYLYDETRKHPVPTKRRKSLRRRSYNLVHRLVLDPDHAGFKLGRTCMSLVGARKGKGLAYTSFSAVERAIKYAAFDCQDCGDCYLPENFGLCTLGGCEKGLSNAPCGDSTADGRCGNNLERVCIGDRIYETAVAEAGGAERLRGIINKPRMPELEHTSSILNYLFGTDHTKASPLISIGDLIDASHPKTGKVMKEILDLGEAASEQEVGPIGYIKALIQSQADHGADYIAVNVDTPSDKEGQLAVKMIAQYVQFVRRWGGGVPVCIDSRFEEVLNAGLTAWYGTNQPVSSPLLSAVRRNTADKVMALRATHNFNIVTLLADPAAGCSSADEALDAAKRLFEAAVGQYGFTPKQVFFDPSAVPLMSDESTAPNGHGRTYSAFETIRRIKTDAQLKRCHCLLRISHAARNLPGRAVGVSRAYVAKAMDFGLDAVFASPANHFGEIPADPGLLALVDAYARMDGSPERDREAKALMDKFCAQTAKKPPRPSPQSPAGGNAPLATGKPKKTHTENIGTG